MNIVFYLSAAVAIVATGLVITRSNAMHALMYLVLSFLAVSLMFFTLGAPFIAALEVIVYAGAIMVLFIFAIMLLNVGTQAGEQERRWLQSGSWVGPALLALVLLGELVYLLLVGLPGTSDAAAPRTPVAPQLVGVSLFTTYLIGVELASLLLLSSVVGAYHIGQGRREAQNRRRERVIQAATETIEQVGPAPIPEGVVAAVTDSQPEPELQQGESDGRYPL